MPIRLTVPDSHILVFSRCGRNQIMSKAVISRRGKRYSVLALFRPWLSVLYEWPFSLLLLSEVKPPRVVAGYLAYNGLVHTSHVPVDDLVGIRPYGITVGIV
jgi:hypothetical protein